MRSLGGSYELKHRDGQPTLDVVLSVDWEGSDLRSENLGRIKNFKNQHEIPLCHFLNPAYYTSEEAIPHSEISERIRSVLGPSDQIGVHLHPFKHLVEKAGVSFQAGPTFSRRGQCQGKEEGMDVMLHAYPYQDLEKLIGFSKSLLEAEGFKNLRGFRAGGWMADSTVCECLKLHGFEFDSSATMGSLLNGSSWEGDNLQRYVDILWPSAHLLSQTYALSTSFGELFEVPNNFGAVDYWTRSGVDFFASSAVNEALKCGGFRAVINSHQETACEHWDKLDQFVHTVTRVAHENQVELRFISDMLPVKELPADLENYQEALASYS